MDLKEALKSMNFFALEENLPSLAQQLCQTLESPEALKKNQIKIFPSLINADAPTKFQSKALLVDVGGSSTKAALRLYDKLDSIVNWIFLFEVPNSSLNKGASSHSYQRFCAAIAELISVRLKELIINHTDIKALGMIWSNAMESRPASSMGITGIVSSRENYKKGEWFIQDLQDGDDLGATLLAALKEVGIGASTCLIGNDVPLTMKALSGSQAGLVVSTGVNGTLVQTIKESGNVSKRVIFNAELGRNLKIESKYLTKIDCQNGALNSVDIEYFVGGRFLPVLFSNYIIALSGNGFHSLKPLAGKLQELRQKNQIYFTSEDMGLLLEKNQAVRKKLGSFAADSDLIHDLTQLSSELLSRAAKLAALVAYASVSNQFEERREFVLALDSRLAREIPIFWELMKSQLASFAPSGKQLKLTLLQRLESEGGLISVPMLGAATALDNFCR